MRLLRLLLTPAMQTTNDQPRAARAKKPAPKKTAPQRTPDKKTKPIELIQAEGHGVCLSMSELAIEFGRDPDTIKKRITELDIRPTGKRNGYPVYRLRDVIRTERLDENGKMDPDKMRPAERSAFYRSENDRLTFERDCGLLYQRHEIEAELASVFRVVTQELDTLVDELERDVQPSPVVLSRIEDKLLLARERMYQAIAEGKTTSGALDAQPAAKRLQSWDVGP